MYMHIYVYIFVYTYIYIYIYIHMYKFIDNSKKNNIYIYTRHPGTGAERRCPGASGEVVDSHNGARADEGRETTADDARDGRVIVGVVIEVGAVATRDARAAIGLLGFVGLEVSQGESGGAGLGRGGADSAEL